MSLSEKIDLPSQGNRKLAKDEKAAKLTNWRVT